MITRGARWGAMVSWGLWAACLIVGAVATFRHDAIVSVGPERWLIPAAVAGAMVPVWIMLDVQRRLVAGRVPRWSVAVGTVPPALVLGLVWGPGWTARMAAPADAPPTVAAGPSIVLVTLDSFRADHLGALVGGTLTPNLDTLAGQGLLFTQAVTTAPLSAPAHASMLTGLGVLEHGLTSNGAAVRVPTVVEKVRAAGYRTGAFLGAQVIDRDSGLHVGFEHYDDRWGMVQRLAWLPALAELHLPQAPPRRSGAETVDRALEWLATDDGPAFLWVHLYDAHAPYAPPSEFQPSAAALDEARRMDREDMGRRGDLGLIGNRPRSRVREQTLLYGASLRWVDALVGRLVGRLPPDTIVIVAADHGENLGEHGDYFSHGANVWETAINVPMMVRWPGRFDAGSRFEVLTSVTLVARLIEEGAGLTPPTPPAGSATAFVYTTGQDARQVDEVDAARSPPTACVRREGGKTLRRGDEPAVWFDLMADPGELNPLPVPAELVNDVAVLEQVLSKPVPRLDDAQRERLEKLGYRE